MEVAATCLHWSQSVVSHSPPVSHTLASSISPPPSKRRSTILDDGFVSRFIRPLDRSALFGTMTKLQRTRSWENAKSRGKSLRRVCSASLEDNYSDEEFAERLQELVMRFHVSDDESEASDAESSIFSGARNIEGEISSTRIQSSFNSLQNSKPFESPEPPWVEARPDPPDWPERNEIIPVGIERKANSVDLPLSLRILKRKKQWQEGFREAGENAYCSVKKAFSSMVFIIRELQSYSLQMREILFYEDLQGILVRVQKEMHASFVWLFEQIFSRTPTLMVYVMILLANFTVYSMGNNAAIAAVHPPDSYITETVSVAESGKQQSPLSVKSFSISSSAGRKMTSVEGGGSGGGKIRPVAGPMDGGDGRFENSSSLSQYRKVFPADSSLSSIGNPTITEEGVSGAESEWEVKLWNSMVEEAVSMQAGMKDESLTREVMQRFVSPIHAEIEPDDYTEYFKTELLYQHAVSQEPHNALLLCNYAQFLYLVVHDHDRAEEYFKRAIRIEPPDAESLSSYASFLWLARKDITAAEETYLEAITADPGNTTYAASYAHFLWNTGGEETCYPLDTDES